ncbi:nucleoid DNA-binding protein [Pseudomonas psychrophila]|uniref:Nucleoid DNA-binding protein n=1 Tax=Pseudomonas psychrophila TaxID=122355 RepID=A0ABY0VHA1_9PSED|nr:nucleoid DNA-binding protein [Pseudomonas psychrophila]
MRKPDLAAAIAEKADLTKEQANRVLNAVLEEITQALHRKDSVTLVGFGTFIQRHRGARTGQNPQTGQPVSRSPSRPATRSRSSRANSSRTALILKALAT